MQLSTARGSGALTGSRTVRDAISKLCDKLAQIFKGYNDTAASSSPDMCTRLDLVLVWSASLSQGECTRTRVYDMEATPATNSRYLRYGMETSANSS
eukprot:scaffold247786_cov18-Prasinocladus_malaysianus.AAC.2